MDFIVSSKDKVRLIKKLLDENECVLVFLNTANKDLVIPENLKKQDTITLQISLHFQGNMFFLDNGIKVQMIFDVDYEDCFLPWNAIWGAKGEEAPDTNYWLESMPRELKQKIMEIGMRDESLKPNTNDEKSTNHSADSDASNSEKVCDSKNNMKLIKETDKSKENKNLKKNNGKRETSTKKSTKYPNFSIIK